MNEISSKSNPERTWQPPPFPPPPSPTVPGTWVSPSNIPKIYMKKELI